MMCTSDLGRIDLEKLETKELELTQLEHQCSKDEEEEEEDDDDVKTDKDDTSQSSYSSSSSNDDDDNKYFKSSNFKNIVFQNELEDMSSRAAKAALSSGTNSPKETTASSAADLRSTTVSPKVAIAAV